MSFVDSIDAVFVKIARYLNFAILENESGTDNKMKHGRLKKLLVLLVIKVQKHISKFITKKLCQNPSLLLMLLEILSILEIVYNSLNNSM